MSFKVRPLYVVLGVLLTAAASYRLYELSIPMAKRLTSLDDNTRNIAIAQLVKLKPPAKERLTANLLPYMSTENTPDPKSRRYAAYAIRKLGVDSPVIIQAYTTALTDADPDVREEASVALLDMGEKATPSVVALLKSSNPQAQEMALYVLFKTGAAAVPPLKALLHENPPVVLAATALKKIGPNAKEALPDLVALLKSTNADLRIEAALAVNAIQPQPPVEATAPVLAQAINERNWDEKSFEMVVSLEKMELKARAGVSSVEKKLLKSADGFKDPKAARPALAHVLEKIDPRRRELIDLGFDLKQKNPVIRYRAAYVISEMNPPNIGTMEMAVEALADKEVTVSARLLVALARLGFEKTERLKKISTPRIKSAFARVQTAKIEGFDEIVQPALKNLP